MTELPSSEEVNQSLTNIEDAASFLEGQVLELTYVGNRKQVDPEALASILARLKSIKTSLTLMESEASKALATIVSDGSIVDAGGAQLERKDSKPRKTWKHEQVKSVVIEKIMERHTDKDTGAITTPISVMIHEAFSYAGISYWKVAQLKEIGINADNYSSRGESKPKFTPVTQAPTTNKDEEDDFLND